MAVTGRVRALAVAGTRAQLTAALWMRLFGAWHAVRGQLPELLLLAIGIGLRVHFLHKYPPESGYDFYEHITVVDWWAQHFEMPPLLLARGAYHPQLYYALGGMIRRMGGDWKTVQTLSTWFGAARLLLVYVAARRYLPQHRLARVLVLALAAFLPASVHIDIMATQEALNGLLAVGFVIAAMELCRASSERIWLPATVLGLIVGLGMLVKVSQLVILALLAFAPVLELVQRRQFPLRENLRRTRAWLLALAIAVSVCSAQYVYNQNAYGQMIIDGWYKRPTADTERIGAKRVALLDRRTLGYVFGFTTDIVTFPYGPSGVEPAARFWSVLIASSFCDYTSYRFAPASDRGGSLIARGSEVGARATALGRASVASGIWIAIVATLGWLVALAHMLAKREIARPLILLLPALGALGQLHFAVDNPYDIEGVVKGVYFQFSAVPLLAVFGVTVGWLWQNPALRPLAVISIFALAPVAAYTTFCVVS